MVEEPAVRHRRGRVWQVARIVLSVALAGAILAYLLGSAADFSDVRAEIASMTGLELLTLALVAAWNLATYWAVMVAATPGLTFPQAMVLTQSTTAVANTVPGGSAVAVGLTYAMLGSWGFSRSRATLSVVVSGLWNILLAQSVPTAQKIPCIASYPAGWHFASMDIRSGRSHFTLDSDRAGISAVRVSLQARCDVAGATEIPSDEPGTRRFERVLSAVDDFRAMRVYQFEGGCVTYRFDFDRQGRALVNEVSVAIGFISRATVDELVRERTSAERV